MSKPIAVVTGASSGIGAATAAALAEAGFEVIAAARRTDKLAAVAAGIRDAGGDARVVELDVTSQESADALAAEVGGAPLAVLVNNAGGAWGLESV